MEIGYIKRLIELVEESNIKELEASRLWGIDKVLIIKDNNKRHNLRQNIEEVMYISLEKKKIEQEESFLISLMVGTFHRSPGPDAGPYKQEGEEIKKGEIYCIIEAMRLNNEISYKDDGAVIIEKFLVENGKPVEYGQKLAIIKPKTNEH